MTRLQITVPNGNPSDAVIRIDGEKVDGVCAVDISIRPNELATVRIERYHDIELDFMVTETGVVEKRYEHTYETPKPNA
jgi:hypothetical protein